MDITTKVFKWIETSKFGDCTEYLLKPTRPINLHDTLELIPKSIEAVYGGKITIEGVENLSFTIDNESLIGDMPHRNMLIRKVQCIRASGGWGVMNFKITLTPTVPRIVRIAQSNPEVLAKVISQTDIAFDKDTGLPEYGCTTIECSQCMFCNSNCERDILSWLLEEV